MNLPVDKVKPILRYYNSTMSVAGLVGECQIIIVDPGANGVLPAMNCVGYGKIRGNALLMGVMQSVC